MYLHYRSSGLLDHGTAPCHPVLPVILQRRSTQSQFSVAGRHAGEPHGLSTSDPQHRTPEAPSNPPEAHADIREPLEQQQKPVQGRIHSTDSCTMLDGQGVRFMVFMQGCSARCLFCCNPDTWDLKGGTPTTSQQLAAKVSKMAAYLRPNGGGVTCSGGEPLMQPEFVADFFKRCHALGLTTCLDTTGQTAAGQQGGTQGAWDKVLPHTDSVLFCVKHLHPDKYHAITGLQQLHAKAFAEQLRQRQIPFWLRYVLLPGYTDAPEDIQALIDFCREQPTLQGVELLPYHLLGRNKWDELGLSYPLEGVQPPGREAVLAVVDQLEAAGLAVMCDVKEQGTAKGIRVEG